MKDQNTHTNGKKVFLVEKEYEGKRIDQYLCRQLPHFSRTRIQVSIEKGSVTLNGTVVKKHHIVHVGDRLVVDEDEMARSEQMHLTAEDIPLDIVYEDDYFMAINKPAGLVVHPGNGNRKGTLVHGLLFHCKELSHGFTQERPGIVHRLDKDTSGLILVAKSDDAHLRIARLFSERAITKEYFGICIGKSHPETGTIDAPIARCKSNPLRFCVDKNGKEAVTLYRDIVWKQGCGVVRFLPKTGRTHQIRVHCAFRGFPILADDLYGGGRYNGPHLDTGQSTFIHELFALFKRQALHALRISFTHPFTKEDIAITAPYPEDFSKALALFQLNKHFLEAGNA